MAAKKINITYTVNFPVLDVAINGHKIGYIEKKSGYDYYFMYFDNKMKALLLEKDVEGSKVILSSELNRWYATFLELDLLNHGI